MKTINFYVEQISVGPTGWGDLRDFYSVKTEPKFKKIETSKNTLFSGIMLNVLLGLVDFNKSQGPLTVNIYGDMLDQYQYILRKSFDIYSKAENVKVTINQIIE